jgi:ribosomal protein L9
MATQIQSPTTLRQPSFVLVVLLSALFLCVGCDVELKGVAVGFEDSSSATQEATPNNPGQPAVKKDVREVGPSDAEISPQVTSALDSLKADVAAQEQEEKSDAAQESKEMQPADSDDSQEDNEEDYGPIPTIEELEAAQKKIQDEFHLQTIDIPDSFRRLGENHIWIDMANKKVMARGLICLRRGGLEMFACPRNTKEHESIISVHADSFEVHRCFEALGFDPGNPVQWGEEYVAAKGPIIDIEIQWMEDGNLVSRNAKEFVRNFNTKKALQHDWVFGGSVLINDHVSGEEIYYGDGGEMICLSNFATATMDLPIKSSAEAEMGLLFEVFTENVPQVNTKVYLVMTPRAAEEDGAGAGQPVETEKTKVDQSETEQSTKDSKGG